MHPRPAARGSDKVGVVIFDREVVDSVPALRGTSRASSQFFGLVPLPGDICDTEGRPGAADDTAADPQAARFQPAYCMDQGFISDQLYNPNLKDCSEPQLKQLPVQPQRDRDRSEVSR